MDCVIFLTFTIRRQKLVGICLTKTKNINIYTYIYTYEKKEVKDDALCILFNEAMNYEKNKTALINRLYDVYHLGRSNLCGISKHKNLPKRPSVQTAFMKGLLQYLEDRRWEQNLLGETEKMRRIDSAVRGAMLLFFGIQSHYNY